MAIINIGKRIVDLREKRGLSQKDLAEMIPVTPPTLSRWENGLITPPLSQLERIGAVLDLPLEDIISGDKADYDKLRKRFIRVRVLSVAMAVVILVSVLFWIMPKYRIIQEKETYRDDYGKTLIVYVKPLFVITEKGAYIYGNGIAQKYSADSDYELIEVVFTKSSTNYEVNENEYFSNLYFLNSQMGK